MVSDIMKCIALYSSMISSGEDHTVSSEAVKSAAIKAIDKIPGMEEDAFIAGYKAGRTSSVEFDRASFEYAKACFNAWKGHS